MVGQYTKKQRESELRMLDFQADLLKLVEKHGLTDLEYMFVLQDILKSVVAYQLREERKDEEE
jgi:hypothetical protein